MSLDNLLKINQLQRHVATAEEVPRLLAAAQRNLADCEVENLSDENPLRRCVQGHHAMRHGGTDG
jgi:hypothetical protein